jgi:hypothetical protein
MSTPYPSPARSGVSSRAVIIIVVLVLALLVFAKRESIFTDRERHDRNAAATSHKETRNPDSAQQTSQPPDWLHLYPGMTVTHSARTDSGERISGVVSGTTPDPVAQVRDHYNDTFKNAGYTTEVSTTDTADAANGSVTARHGERKDNVVVKLNRAANTPATSVTLEYSGVR